MSGGISAAWDAVSRHGEWTNQDRRSDEPGWFRMTPKTPRQVCNQRSKSTLGRRNPTALEKRCAAGPCASFSNFKASSSEAPFGSN